MKYFQNTTLLAGLLLVGCARPPANQPIPSVGQSEGAKMQVESGTVTPLPEAPVATEERAAAPERFPAVPQVSEADLHATPATASTLGWTPSSETLLKVANGDAEAIRFLGFGSCRLVLIQAYKKRIQRFNEQPSADDLLSALAGAAVPLDATGIPWPCSVAASVEAAGDRALSLVLTDMEMVLVHRFDQAPYIHRSHTSRAEFNNEPAGSAANWPEALAEVQILQIEQLLRHYVGAFGHFPESLPELLSTFNLSVPKGLIETPTGQSGVGTVSLLADPQSMSYCIVGGSLPDTTARRIITFELNEELGEVNTTAQQLAVGDDFAPFEPFASFAIR